jgi:hypothetical protein
MKVVSIEPGVIFNAARGKWGYIYYVNGVARRSGWPTTVETFASPNAAKQAMREKVARERQRHGLK